MIPKIIHYVWVGDKQKPSLVTNCIKTWSKYCPDYQIIEWNNDSLINIKNKYVVQAFQKKKYAFVSDYLRLYALHKFGGFYFDSDLELTNSIDEFINYDFITGFEHMSGVVYPITALMGATPGNKIIEGLLNEYQGIEFINPDGTLNELTNTRRITDFFEKEYDIRGPFNRDRALNIEYNSVVFPSSYFCTPEVGKKNYSIHHFNGSWIDTWYRKELLTMGKYSIVKFKKKKLDRNEDIELNNDEKAIKVYTRDSIRKYFLIKKV